MRYARAMSSSPILGGCLCGAVRFSAEPPLLFCAHCHCHWCRRAHGAAFVTWLGVRAPGFAVTAGADTLRVYASSAQSERMFCARCGTTMLFRSTVAPGEMHIALACVDGPAPSEPTAHVFYDAHVPWVVLGDELPKLERNHAGLSKYTVIAREPLPSVEPAKTP